MAILKSAGTDQRAHHAIVFDMGDLRREAEQLERDSHARARVILEKARIEKQQILEHELGEGFKEGKAKGHEEGLELGRVEGRDEALSETRELVAQLCEQWQEALGRFETDRDGLIAAARSDLLRLAIAIAERVTKRSIAAEPSIVQDQLKAALEQTLDCTRLNVEIAKEDQELIERVLPTLVARFARGAHIDLTPQDSLSRGSIVLRSVGGSVDASIETQLDRITEALLPGSISKARGSADAQKQTEPESDAQDQGE